MNIKGALLKWLTFANLVKYRYNQTDFRSDTIEIRFHKKESLILNWVKYRENQTKL